MNQKHVGWISLQIPMGLKIKKKKMFGSLVCILLSSSLLKNKKKNAYLAVLLSEIDLWGKIKYKAPGT